VAVEGVSKRYGKSDGDCAEIETPKASRGKGVGSGVPSP